MLKLKHYCFLLGNFEFFFSDSASRGTSPGVQSNKSEFRHYGSSLSLANKSVASELTSRTLRPPSPTVLRKLSTSSTTSTGSTRSQSSSRPPLPSSKVDLESPKLADYLDRPRLVSTLHVQVKKMFSFLNFICN